MCTWEDSERDCTDKRSGEGVEIYTTYRSVQRAQSPEIEKEVPQAIVSERSELPFGYCSAKGFSNLLQKGTMRIFFADRRKAIEDNMIVFSSGLIALLNLPSGRSTRYRLMKIPKLWDGSL